MYSSGVDYYRATSVADAVQMLKKHEGAKLLAGGHSLVPAMKLRVANPTLLVDIGRIAGLSGITVGEKEVSQGAHHACGGGVFHDSNSMSHLARSRSLIADQQSATGHNGWILPVARRRLSHADAGTGRDLPSRARGNAQSSQPVLQRPARPRSR
jgi:hypothetical protein